MSARGVLILALMRLRHRRLATAVSALAVALGAALAMVLLLVRGQGLTLVVHQPHGFDLLVGAKGSAVDLTLNTLYHLERSPGTIPYRLAQDLVQDPAWTPLVAGAVPLAVGDSVGGCDLIATTLGLFSSAAAGSADRIAAWDPGHPPRLRAGRLFREGSIDAVIGSRVHDQTGLSLGDSFRPTHGSGAQADPGDVHDRRFTIVGELEPTGTILDRSVFISLAGFWSIDEHEEGLHAQALLRYPGLAAQPPAHASRVAPDGMITLGLPDSERRVSVVLVRSRSPYAAQLIAYRLAAGDDACAVNPAAVQAALLRSLLAPVARLCAGLIALVLLVSGVSILISCYQAVQAQSRELAVMRALGATRSWILGLVVCEAGLTGCAGALLGIVPAHLALGLLSLWLSTALGQALPWWHPAWSDLWVIMGATVGSALIGLAPGASACRIQVAQQLC